MDTHDALAARRSCRSYLPDPVPEDVLRRVLGAARRGPTAGNSWALDLLVLEGSSVTEYWDTTLPAERRAGFGWPGLLDAPVLVLPTVRPGAYVERYAEPDKSRTGLGGSEADWPVPYWWVDAGAAVMAMLLAATAEGLGSLLFGVFDHEAGVRARFGIPDDRRVVGTVALGRPGPDRRPSQSAGRGRPPLDDLLHRRAW